MESLVAMIIILTCAGLATTIVVNVINGNNTRLRLSAYNTLKKIAYQSTKEHAFIDETIKTDAFTIYKTISSYETTGNVFMLRLKAVDNRQNTVAVYNEVISK